MIDSAPRNLIGLAIAMTDSYLESRPRNQEKELCIDQKSGTLSANAQHLQFRDSRRIKLSPAVGDRHPYPPAQGASLARLQPCQVRNVNLIFRCYYIAINML